MRSLYIGTLLLAGVLLTGCSDTEPDKKADLESRQAEWSQTQEKALRDPMNYRADMDRSNVSGGGLTDFDRDAFKKDMKAWTLD